VLLISYLYAIKHLPVSYVYATVTCSSLVVVALLSAVTLGEALSLRAMLAVALILAGVALLSVDQARQ
jgi:multidrug transporter EmrE-like cation transporter